MNKEKKIKPNIQLNETFERASLIINKFKIIAIVIVVGLFYAYMLQKVTSYVNTEPTEEAILEKTSGIKSITINPQDVEKIKLLKETNVEVKAAFDKSRTNPFQTR